MTTDIPHKIITSANDDPTFFNFWELSFKSWKAFFPYTDVILAFVTNRTEDDELVKTLKQWGTVKLYKPIEGIPTPNNAKVVRMIEAAKHENSVCMIQDIDLIPLQQEYIIDRMSYFESDKLLGIGFFTEPRLKDKFPMTYATATGHTWRKIVNPDNLNYIDLTNSWKNINIFDTQEAINKEPSNAQNIWGFSDESLLRYLRSKIPDITKRIDRNFLPHIQRVDRGDWSQLCHKKLNQGFYVDGHLLRPPERYQKELRVLADYINKHYEQKNTT